jgi:tRNA (guanine37-N1)-methyltransferase
MMRIDILTLFPPMFEAQFGSGIFKRAIDNGLVKINLVNIREFTHDKHHTADDSPYGGGAGMVLKAEPIFEAVESVKASLNEEAGEPPVILMSPQGRLFSHKIAQELSQTSHMILICGHYEGVDERVAEHLATDTISIGDYVLTGGEVPAMVVADAVLRLVPGVLGSEESPLDDSHANGLLEYPQYTRPPELRGWAVPEILLSGNHAQIAKWRREQIIRRTLERRPELLDKADLGKEDKRLVELMTNTGYKINKDRES